MTKTKLNLVLAASLFASAGAASANDADWIIAPYLWLPNISGDVTNLDLAVGGNPSNGNGNTNIMDLLVWGFMVHTEAQGDNWGFLNEITYADLSETNTRTFDLGDGDVGYKQTGENQDWIIDLAVVWAPGDTKFLGFEPYAGIRYLDVQMGLDLKPIVNDVDLNTFSFNGDDSWTDFLVGAKYSVPLSEKWALAFRGDYSFGDTEGTWLLSANAIYATKSGAWAFGYRYMGIELPINNTGSNLDLSLYGLQAGYAFKF
jgi:hypothetical protein